VDCPVPHPGTAPPAQLEGKVKGEGGEKDKGEGKEDEAGEGEEGGVGVVGVGQVKVGSKGSVSESRTAEAAKASVNARA